MDGVALGLFWRVGDGTGCNVHLRVHLLLMDFLMEYGALQTEEMTLCKGI